MFKVISELSRLTLMEGVATKLLVNQPVRCNRYLRPLEYPRSFVVDKPSRVAKYSLYPLRMQKTGGRGPDGQKWNHRRAGGATQRWRQVDYKRVAPQGEPLQEKVVCIRYDPCRSSHIAIVASKEHKRYILASENMKAGDIIKTSSEIPRMVVKAKEGDAHPLGALAVGTLVHNVEIFPEEGGKKARAAGTCCQLVRKIGDRCIVRLPSKHEIEVSHNCMVTIGRVSNVDHGDKHIGSPNRMRWLGIMQRSGLWHRKTGYNGRKIRPLPPVRVYNKPKPPTPSMYKYTF